MAESTTSPAPFREEKTFRAYTSAQGDKYAKARPNYHASIYEAVLQQHTSTGGGFDTIIDVGCGPGTAVRELAPRFTQAFGLDPSEGMLSTARGLGGATATGQPIRFEVSSAEQLGKQLSPPVADGSVDLIVASTAAHWFDMDGFWPRAAEVLRPGGSVAIWASSGMRIHPSTPNYDAIQAAWDKCEALFEQYEEPGSLYTRHLYTTLPLPWNLSTPSPEFDQASFFRREWHSSQDGEEGNFFSIPQVADLDKMEKILSTSSKVTRWREAHPDVAETKADPIKVLRTEIARLLREKGVREGEERLRGDASGVLLVVKRK